MKRPTIADIARAAGVSKGAVSYALNGKPGVSERTRSRVLALAEQLGWAPSSTARALSDGRAGAIGLVVDRPAAVLAVEPFFMRFIAGVQDALGAGPTSLTLRVSPDRDAELEVYRRWAGERRVDGVILVDLRVDDPRPDLVASLGLPAVVVGGPLGRPDLPSVWTDDAGGMTDAVEYLAALGHRRIARVAGPAEFVHTEVRSQAFQRVAARLGLVEARTAHADYSDEGGAAAARRLLAAPDPPTAVLFDNDVMAVAALGVAAELGLSVPADVSLLAWDDSALCRLVRPALSAVRRRPGGEHGELAARLLLDLLAGQPGRDVRTADPVLVPRASTGPAPAR